MRVCAGPHLPAPGAFRITPWGILEPVHPLILPLHNNSGWGDLGEKNLSLARGVFQSRVGMLGLLLTVWS